MRPGDRPGPEDGRLRRAGTPDKVLLALLATIWALCFAASLRTALRPAIANPWVSVRSEGVERHPRVVGIAPWSDFSTSDLRVGDRMIRVGAADLVGTGPLGFHTRFVAEARDGRPLHVTYEREGERREITLHPPPGSWGGLPTSLALAFTALFLALRAPPSLLTRSVGQVFLLWAIVFATPFTGGVALNYAALGVSAASNTLGRPLGILAVLILTRGAPPARPWARLAPWCFAVTGPLEVSFLTGFPLRGTIGVSLRTFFFVAYLVTLLVLVAMGYRAADAVRRRQLRWVVLGFYAALAPAVTLSALRVLDFVLRGGAEWFSGIEEHWFFVLLPLSILLAIARYNLFDVDRLLSAAASYNVVLVALVGAGLVAVPWFGEFSARLLGIDPRMGQAALGLALAAVVVPAHQRLRPRIDRLFFKERHALDQGIAELLRSLAACEDTRTLTRRVGEELHRLLRPEACVVYARTGESFAPVFVEGRAVPPAFGAESPLVATLAGRRKPLALSDAGRTPDPANLGPFDRAALQTLEVEVVVPVRRETLAAFLCLGSKRSGDVYTSTDLAHLAAVAEAVSAQLRRLDQEQVIREAQAMQESLRRYVPGAVAEELASGAELEPEEREVSVLFVDIRGYTAFSEPRRAAEIFSTVNRYTEAVSAIVRERGGSVVEFNGDGMMAVFGAPRPLAQKERAAVEAGREISTAMGALPLEDPEGRGVKLTVGVGIATGLACVGNIQAADRLIWSAIGNTTNLAARLQTLSRQLDAALVIDAATFDALGAVGSDFHCQPSLTIRGRSTPQVVYTLPGDASRSARAASAPPADSGR
jgi:class 3 adenylate cyclase